MSFGLILTQTQKLALTPQLQLALKILQLPIEALRQEVATALQENPFIDLDEVREEETLATDGSKEELTWDSVENVDGDLWDVVESPRSLWSYLLEQLRCLDLAAEEDMRVQWLIGALDERGFLAEPLKEIANQYPIKEDFELQNWETALKTLQSLDPTGVGATSVRDCLLIQLRNCQAEKKVLDLSCRIIEDFFEEFARKKFDFIRKSTECSEDDLKRAEGLIHALNPHPVSEFAPLQINYAIPEVEVYRSFGDWKVRLVQSVLPKLKLNSEYALALRSKDASEDSYQIWQRRLIEARQLIRSIDQRHDTLLRVSGLIVEKQKEFFNQGPEKMRPMVLREIADELGMHESTISRVSRGKYLASPQGVFELRYFFSSFLHSSSDDGAISATAAKTELRKILEAEDGKKPFSDEKLSQILEKRGIRIARRTVAKYREALGFPSASLRKRL